VLDDRPNARPRGQWPSPEWFLFGVIALILVRQLLLPPIVGLADNGDFARVLEPLGLQHRAIEWGERYFGWLGQTYVPGPRVPGHLVSSQLLLTGLAKALAGLGSRDGSLDIRTQGAVHLALYLLGIALILRAARTFRPPARATIGVALLLAATDVAWVAPLNSFYGEAATLVFLSLLLGCGLLALRDDRARPWALPGYFVATALFVAAKPQNYFLALPLMVVPLALWPRLSRARGRAAVLAAAIAVVALSLFLQARVPWALRIRNLWNSVFYTALRDSPDPAGDLAQFGLGPELVRYAGVPAFADSIPIEAATARLGYGDVLRFHARHPGRFLRTASACAGNAFVWRDPRMGNYTHDSGRPAGTLSRDFALWSRVEGLALPRSLLFLVVFLGGVLTVGLVEARRAGVGTVAGGTAALCAALALAAGMEFGICVVGDGLYDIVKHLYLFQLLFDVCLFAAIAWSVGLAARGLSRL
jgi:hypothetical protein